MKRLLALLISLFPAVAVAQSYRLGQGPAISCTSSTPTHEPGRGVYWCNSADSNNPYFTPPGGTAGALTGGGGGGGSGSVTSVSMTVPSILSVSGSPVTTSGTLALILANQSANTVLAGGTSGGAATPSFRSLVAADIPSLSATYLPLAGGTMSGAITLSGTQLGTYTLGGTPTLGASLSVGSGFDITAVGGASDIDYSASSGVFKTPTGAATLAGDTTISGSKTFTTGTGAVALNGSTTLASGKTLTLINDALSTTFTQSDTSLFVKNTTAAAAGAQQYSPLIDLSAAGWETGGGTSIVEHMALQNQVFQGTTPTFALNFMRASAAGDYTSVMSLSNTGDLVWPALSQGSIDLSSAVGSHGSISSGGLGITSNGPLTVASPQTLTVNGDNVGTTQAARAILVNGVSAATGAQKYSPLLELQGQGFKSDDQTSQIVKMGLQTRPVQGSSNPTGELVLWKSVAGASYSEVMKFTDGGKIATPSGGITVDTTSATSGTTGYFNVANGGTVQWRAHNFSGNGPTWECLSGADCYVAGGNTLTLGRTITLSDSMSFSGVGTIVFQLAANPSAYKMTGLAFGPFTGSTDGIPTLGSVGHRWNSVYLGSVVANAPACAVANDQGVVWVKQATAGNKSRLQVCLKGADDAYHLEDAYVSAN